MAPQNNAAYLMAKQDPTLRVQPAPYNPPGPDEIVLRATALAINPCDPMVQDLGILIGRYPAILGQDVAGIVEEVGPGVTSFAAGDRVVGFGYPEMFSEDPQAYRCAAFQEYVVIKLPFACRIPDGIPDTHAAVLPLGIATAVAHLNRSDTLCLALPGTGGGNGKTVLIWGGSSSVGCCAIQLASAAGYEVYAVASARNHALCRDLGAAQVFDYNDGDIDAQLTAAMRGRQGAGVFSAIGEDAVLDRLIRIVAAVDSFPNHISIVNPGAIERSTPEMRVSAAMAETETQKAAGTHVWRDWLPRALADGSMRCAPAPRVIGHGLAALQGGFDEYRKGVSAAKLVVTVGKS